jgi:hypothetical protein
MIYVRNRLSYNGVGIYVGRPSPLGNPYSHRRDTIAKFKVATREDAIDRYEDYLRTAIKTDGEVRTAFDAIVAAARKGDVTLICWCAPLPCHADVIVELVEESK